MTAPVPFDRIAEPRSQFVWVEGAGRYRGPGGRFVSGATIRGAIDDTLAKSERRVRALAAELQADRIGLDTWTREMRREIKRVHLWNAAAARGGWAQMTPADFGRVGAVVKRQYQFLYRFAGAIERGLPLDGRMVRRAMMYAESGRGTFEHFNSMEAEARGAKQERNRLSPAEHCAGCLAATARGWVKIRTLPRPGQRLCRSHCKCRLEFR